MKKSIVFWSLILLVGMLFSACAGETESPVDTIPGGVEESESAIESESESFPAESESVSEETETETAPAESEEESAAAESESELVSAEFPDVENQIWFPLPEQLRGAVLEEASVIEDKDAFFLGYSNATLEDAQQFVTYAGYCGLYHTGPQQNDGRTIYYLARPGSDFIGIVIFDSENAYLYVEAPSACMLAETARLKVMEDYYLQDISLPTGYGPNVLPEFYASVGRGGADNDGMISNLFGEDPELCWYEFYSNLEYADLHRYLSDMMLCGFDIQYDSAKFSEDVTNTIVSAVYMISNGTSRVAVSYNTEDKTATVFYEPGVDRYLFKGAEYAAIIPEM